MHIALKNGFISFGSQTGKFWHGGCEHADIGSRGFSSGKSIALPPFVRSQIMFRGLLIAATFIAAAAVSSSAFAQHGHHGHHGHHHGGGTRGFVQFNYGSPGFYGYGGPVYRAPVYGYYPAPVYRPVYGGGYYGGHYGCGNRYYGGYGSGISFGIRF
jgi:hypothetical protein